MFWRFGGYANVSAVDTLLDKPEFTLEELLDESDLIQELKNHNTKLIEYLREDTILERLLEYVVAPKVETPLSEEKADESGKGKEKEEEQQIISDTTEQDDDEREKKRNRYAYVSAEILSSDNWSLCESLMENQPKLRKFWGFLQAPPPLDPLQASYFTKVNESLLDRKTEEMLELFKSLDGAVKNMLQHVDSPMVMDLLLKIISLEKAEGGQGIVDWLHSQNLMPILLSFLSSEHSWATQTSAGDFLKAIITISANASQNEQSCIGPNELTRQLVSKECVEKLISDMLKGGNPLTVGVGIVIEVIRKNNSDYDPEVGSEASTVPSSRDPIYLGNLLRMFAQRVPDFMDLILSPNHTIGGGDGPVTIRRKELNAAFGGKIEPLGFDRFKTCELMAELLHCSNMGLLNEVGSEEFIKARDQERERLKSEGRLGTFPNQSVDDDLTMKSSTQTRPDSADGHRRLEIQNATDDDGFEEVTHSTELGDESKDNFIEKPDLDDLLAEVKPAPLSFGDKEEDDFVDEPLSPAPHATEKENDNLQIPDLTVAPLSPTKELSQKVGSLSIPSEEEDTVMTSPPLSTAEPVSTAETSSTENPEKVPETTSQDSAKDLQHENKSETVEPTAAELAAQQSQHEETLAHPEDRPAPLFAKKTEPASAPIANIVLAENEDTTMSNANDTSSILIGDAGQQSSAEVILPPPVVGDFLKIQFVEHRVVPTILDFFFRFPWNNFLHNVVYDVVQQVFNGPMDRGFNRSLATDLFETGDITMRIVDGQKRSDEAQKKSKMRLGYMGHLTLIAEEVVKFTERHPPELLSDLVLEKVMNGEWISYVEVTLAETRERDNAILGGQKPDTLGGRLMSTNTQSSFSGSSALADAGLNGSAGLDSIDLANGNNSGFTLSGGTLLSGFGSSSDEEDDEMDEDIEDDGARNNGGAAEFSRYITPQSTTTATSDHEITPPLQPPPPPPPLNIPPSRARRQLAARLALHSKQNAEANGTDSEKPSKLVNPFATEEDDDSENEDADFTIGDLEAEEEGKGHLPPATGLENSKETVEELLGDQNTSATNTVGTPRLLQAIPVLSSTRLSARTMIPSLWPFGSALASSSYSASATASSSANSSPVKSLFPTSGSNANEKEQNRAITGNFPFLGSLGAGHLFNADNINPQCNQQHTSFDDDSNSSDDDGDFSTDGPGSKRHKRRPSLTTEAKRRTSLEDDDEDEEVVHVKLDVTEHADTASNSTSGVKTQDPTAAAATSEDESDLVEIRRDEVIAESKARLAELDAQRLT